jgi:hypothetical protein
MPGVTAGRKVRDGEEARMLLGSWAASGQRMSDWCGERGINWYSLSAFRGWHDRHGSAEAVTTTSADGLVEVVTTEAAKPAQRASSVFRVLVGDYTVEVGNDFDDDGLRRLLRLVSSC